MSRFKKVGRTILENVGGYKNKTYTSYKELDVVCVL